MVSKTRRNQKHKRKTVKRKGGGSATETAIVPSSFCAVSPEPMPPEPLKPLFQDSAPFPKPWVNLESNILFTALVISETSVLGLRIKSLCALAGQDPYAGEIGSVLEMPHISIMNIYVPMIAKRSIHGYARSNIGFEMVAEIIAEVVKRHLIDKGNVLHSVNNSYSQFGKFVVKKFKDETMGHQKFIQTVYKPFKDDIVNSLGTLIGGEERHPIKCFPAYFPQGKAMQTFTHYTTDKTNKTSDFAISKYFEEDLSPHISLIKSEDPVERANFIQQVQAEDTRDMNQVELGSKDISSIFVSYMGKWAFIPLYV
jgi:hypothetical protein